MSLNLMRKLAFQESESIFMRKDEAILRELWLTICNASDGYLDPQKSLEILASDITDEQNLYTIGDTVYWSDPFSDDQIPISDDRELRNAVAAFNALRGRIDLIYYSQDEYSRDRRSEEKKGD